MVKLMIVENEESVVESLKMALGDEFDTVAVLNGQDCLDSLEQARPDVILMDYQMEGLDGAQVLERLLTHRLKPAVVLLSARLDMDLCRLAMKLGAVDCLAKPCDLRILKHKLRLAAQATRHVGQAKPFALRIAEKLNALAEPDAAQGMGFEDRRMQFQNLLLSEALFDCGGDQRRAAERLGLQLEEFSRLASLNHVDPVTATRAVASAK